MPGYRLLPVLHALYCMNYSIILCKVYMHVRFDSINVTYIVFFMYAESRCFETGLQVFRGCPDVSDRSGVHWPLLMVLWVSPVSQGNIRQQRGSETGR